MCWGAGPFADHRVAIDSGDVCRGGGDKVERVHRLSQHRDLRDRLPFEPLPVIPAPRREPVPLEADDEIDTDIPAVIEAVVAQAHAKVGLTDRDLAILAFEKQGWRHAGSKEQAIRDRFDLSGTRYYQLLNALLDNPAAVAQEPILVGRLRRLRGSRARARGR